jgi:hypothetical protein
VLWRYIVNYLSFSANLALCDFGILRRNRRPWRNHHSGFCRILAIAVIVFQLRVVARAPKIRAPLAISNFAVGDTH